MAKGKQEGLGDELFGTRLGEFRDASGPVKGEFVPPPDISETKEIEEALSKIMQYRETTSESVFEKVIDELILDRTDENP
jgi:hypothetical protein